MRRLLMILLWSIVFVSVLITCGPAEAAAASSDSEQRIIDLVNQERVKAGLSPLERSDALAASARSYSRYMATANFFAHNGPDGSTPVSRNTAAGYADLAPDQYNQALAEGLSVAQASSICGPALAVGLARAVGLDPTLTEVVRVATTNGLYIYGLGMRGPLFESRLLDLLGVPHQMLTLVDWHRVKQETVQNRPVGISTPGHYYLLQRYDPATDKYFVGNTGKVIRGGSDWMSLAQMTYLQGAVQAAFHLTTAVKGGNTEMITTGLWTAMAENIAAGQSRPEDVVRTWMESPSHRANLLSPQFREVGAGYYFSGSSTYGHYWTLELGARVGS